MGWLPWLLLVAQVSGPISQPAADQYPCQASAETLKAIDDAWVVSESGRSLTEIQAERISRLRSLARQHPENFFFQLAYLLFRASPTRIAEEATADYRQRLAKQPGDPVAVFLYGYSLLGRNTAELIVIMEDLVRNHPKFAWPYFALAEAHAKSYYGDKDKARHYLETAMALCPKCLEPYRQLVALPKSDFLTSAMKRMRDLLAEHTDTWSLLLYSDLWYLEQRIAPIADQKAVENRIREDLKTLHRIEQGRPDLFRSLLRKGHHMIGESSIAEQLLAADSSSLARWERVVGEMQRWNQERARSGQGTPPEKNRAYWEYLARRWEEWVQIYPFNCDPWLSLLRAIVELGNHSNDEVVALGKKLIDLCRSGAGADRMRERYPLLALSSTYAQRGVCLDEIPSLIREGIVDGERRSREDVSDLSGTIGEEQSNFRLRLAANDAWHSLVDAHLRSQDPGKARAALGEIKTGVEKCKQLMADAKKKLEGADPQGEADRRGYDWMITALRVQQGRHLEALARLALAENRRLDAFAFLDNAIRTVQPLPSGDAPFRAQWLEKARGLWDELGGTKEGWEARNLGTEETPVEEPAAATDRIASAESPPIFIDRPLPESELTDLQGKMRKLSDWRGKTIFMNVWATWCAPCVRELPLVQKLHEMLKDSPHVAVVTLNMDVHHAVVPGFLKQRGYTFTVLFAESLQTDFGVFSIPRNWIVDKSGVIRAEIEGPEAGGESWIQRVISRIDKFKN